MHTHIQKRCVCEDQCVFIKKTVAAGAVYLGGGGVKQDIPQTPPPIVDGLTPSLPFFKAS